MSGGILIHQGYKSLEMTLKRTWVSFPIFPYHRHPNFVQVAICLASVMNHDSSKATISILFPLPMIGVEEDMANNF